MSRHTSASLLRGVIDALQARNCNPQEQRDGSYKCLCPAHDDHNPSLDVTIGDKGHVLFKCWSGGCGHDAIMRALNLTNADVFLDDGKFKSKPPARPKKKPVDFSRAADHTYVYSHADGSYAYQVDKYYECDPDDNVLGKTFVQRHRANGRLVKGRGGEPYLLYHLPEILAADPRQVVFWAEGEKVCDRLAELGQVATTTTGGAKNFPKNAPDLSALAGRDVVVLPDADDPGRDYSKNVAYALYGIAQNIWIVPLSHNPNSGDDFIEYEERGGTVEDIIERISIQTPWEPEAHDKTILRQREHDHPAGLDAELAGYQLTDTGNAERLIGRFGVNLMFCRRLKTWYHFDGKRWVPDEVGHIRELAKATARKILSEAATRDDKAERKALVDHSISSESRSRIDAMIELATSDPRVAVKPDDLDKDNWLFNVENGTIDLRDGTLRDHCREDRITKLCPHRYDPNAQCPNWLKTCDIFFQGNHELIGFWQRLMGSAMCGVIRDHILPIAYGDGKNGKSTFLNTALHVFGPYAMQAPQTLLMAKSYETHPTEQADLFGMRLVIAQETGQGCQFNEALVKTLTGGDNIRARHLYQEFFTFKPTHTIVIATNHKPVVRGSDYGIWRRLRLVPFLYKMPDDLDDKTMPEKLQLESDGILTWFVQGCLEWGRNGLMEPEIIQEKTAEYRSEQDVLGSFLDECTIQGPSHRIKSGALYARYKEYVEASGERALSQTSLSNELTKRNFKKTKSSYIWIEGLDLRENSSSWSGD